MKPPKPVTRIESGNFQSNQNKSYQSNNISSN